MTSSQLSKIKQLREIDRSQPQLLAPVRSGLRYHLRYQWRPVDSHDYRFLRSENTRHYIFGCYNGPKLQSIVQALATHAHT